MNKSFCGLSAFLLMVVFLASACSPSESAKIGTDASDSPDTSANGANPNATAVTVDNAAIMSKLTGYESKASAKYDENGAVNITFDKKSADIDGDGAVISNNALCISKSGVYILSGSFNGSVSVQAGDNDVVQLVLKNVSITAEENSALLIENAKRVIITCDEGTSNTISDTKNYPAVTGTETEPDAAIYSKDDLYFNGTGALNITGNYGNAVTCKNDLEVNGTSLTLKAVNNGLKGKDSVVILDGSVNVTSGNDGIKSTNSTEADKGYIYIAGGSIDITADFDGIQAQNLLYISGGNISAVTSGGSTGDIHSNGDKGGFGGFWGKDDAKSDDSADEASAKGLKCAGDITVAGGSITVDSLDDSIHGSNVTISGGKFALSTDDDGIHADAELKIDGGKLNIARSYEGIEGKSIVINGGTIDLTSSDDGMNASGGSDDESTGGWGRDKFSGSSDCSIVINGGDIHVNAAGDGIDSNGDLTFNGGTTYVSGPTDNGNGPLDFGEGCTCYSNGGILIAAGSSGMAEHPAEDSSKQPFLYATFGSVSGGSEISVSDADGKTLVSFSPEKQFESVVITCPDFTIGETYTLHIGSDSCEFKLSSTMAYFTTGDSSSDTSKKPGGRK